MGQKKKREKRFVKKNTTGICQLQREIALVLTICPDPRKIFHMRGYLQYELVLLKGRDLKSNPVFGIRDDAITRNRVIFAIGNIITCGLMYSPKKKVLAFGSFTNEGS